MLDEQARHVADVVKAASSSRRRSWSLPGGGGQAGWRQSAPLRWTPSPSGQACTPGYYNGEGRAGEGQGLFDGLYGPGSEAFFALMKAWREAGDMRGLEVR